MKRKTISTRKRLLLAFVPLLALGCGKEVAIVDVAKIQVHIEDLTCAVVVYPEWRRDCTSAHFICSTWRTGQTTCTFHATNDELREKM